MSEYGQSPEPGVVRFERLLPGPIERVWAYLTEGDKRARWFAGGEMDLRKGGALSFLHRHSGLSDEPDTPPEKYRDMHENGFTSTGTVLRAEAPRLLSFAWHEDGAPPSIVAFELAPQGDQVRLVLTHSQLKDHAEMVNVSGGWHSHLDVLAEDLAGGPRRAFWPRHAGVEGEYERRLPA
ncbi:SRPBCC family protein [Phenylobacterium sp.]|jgi:uncharacterized protein YndB with AHSA1/START domain|uniref:SRPBCC family protein n=1 Tax=Phenylobacterium sp. TaxID=1871053 RepID=UPI0037831E0B